MGSGSPQVGVTILTVAAYVGAWAPFIFATELSFDSLRPPLAFYLGSHVLAGFAIGRPTAAWLVFVAALMALLPGAGLWPLVLLWALFAVLLVWTGVVARRLVARAMRHATRSFPG